MIIFVLVFEKKFFFIELCNRFLNLHDHIWPAVYLMTNRMYLFPINHKS